MTLGFELRAGEGLLVRRAAAVAVCAGAAGAMVASAGDALFIARVGLRHLGTVMALSSAALVLSLGYVGALADRADRGRLLGLLSVVAVVAVCGLAALMAVAPRSASVLLLVVGKQLAAAIDLGFWVLIAERVDARQGRRLVPVFIAALGVGSAAGAFAVGPLAGALGARGVLLVAAGMYAACSLACLGLARAKSGRTMPRRVPARRLSWTGGWTAVRRSRLATHLAWTVAIAGIFAPILYYLLGAAAAAHYADETALAGFFGQYRGAVQVAVLFAVLAAPWLLARIGVAPALLLAPLGAVLAAVALAVSGGLILILVAQASARLLDTAVQTPAEKLVQNLVPHRARGRVQGFIDGLAKRAGAIVGGLLASALIVWPSVLAGVTLVVAAAWLALAASLRRRFAQLAVAELVVRAAEPLAEASDDDAVILVDERSLAQLRADLERGGDRRRLAADLLLRLDEHGRVDAVVELVGAAARAQGPERLALLRAVDRVTLRRPVNVQAGVGEALVRMLDEADEERALVVAVLGRVSDARDQQVEASLAGFAEGSNEATLRTAARLALARIRGDGPGFDQLLDQCLGSEELAEREAALLELRADLARALALAPPALTRALPRARRLIRALRQQSNARATVAGLLVLADLGRVSKSAPEPELVLLRGEMRDLAGRLWDQEESSAQIRAAAIELLATVAGTTEAPVLGTALADPDDEVRRAAAAGLRAMGEHALEVLLVASNFGRRPARNAALEIVRDLRISSAGLDHLIERELAEIDQTTLRLAPLASLEGSGALVRRLEERVGEAAHTLFLALEAKLGEPAIGLSARQFLRARDATSRARALETLDTVLPRVLARRVLAPLDAGSFEERSRRAAERLGCEPLGIDSAVDQELEGADLLARALVVHGLGAGGRAHYRAAITAAAARAAVELDPAELIRRIAAEPANAPELDGSQEEDDMPRNVETIMILSELAIFGELTTRQLAELAEVVRWELARTGRRIIEQDDHGDAFYFVLSGAAQVTVVDRDSDQARELGLLGPGDVFGEMALFEGDPRSATVTATARTRLGRIDRVDFEELVEEVPGIALAICRVLSRRVRTLNQRVAA